MAAEKLFAEQGLDAVSTRMIARAAGQKNNSALQYHFANRDSLVEAILDYRVSPVNQQRLKRLQQLQAIEKPISTRALVEVFVRPFAEELLKPIVDTYYVSLLAQLYAYQRGRELYLRDRERARALHSISALLIRKLAPLPQPVVHLRLQFMGRQTINAVAEWDEARRQQSIELDERTLAWRTENLVDFIVAGMQAPDSSAKILRSTARAETI
ncbi:MAG: TetR family transcriptional regulator [Gammaproteobacteria bacterium]|nr:TetR family transcriptional regulator [Gammaproteobacteria bacterium]MBT8150135.1 TetR family transcriptional regulator [Gammaproteobacteria bacterium]NNL11300.1 TetR/AcrR family transcriptional regulator [Pseudomonadales bacterium]NNM10938.1 TetR/AcrR family transcriptional regulator [Pseudomonadales bacterium]RZV56134.1 MAG: TetR/AcrR family transcriptional regulator [Pseudomonadales bacterium]